MNISLKHNVGPIDRFIRVILGAIFLIIAFLAPTLLSPTLALIIGIFGIITLLEGIVGY